MHIVVVANGELPSPHAAEMAQVFADADQLVAVDGGLVHCVDLGVWPSVLLGDLDSAPPTLVEQANLHQVRLLTFPADKDATDLE
ncbi:MAG TPA: thiamine diphosphokinase, partial [Acidimicrobiaceae bacterium]|nr:thiamine diphosphokinase [Acidimicrobiaceae bacterium]